ncbi:hypothetical protein HCN44_009020 [Aphidius gifuensis]|uniref:Uncharacterized protein n=1 Tax=Aphidius gifuensis TaxID=684658 RepID=A0A835CNB2_APHGI|nr:ankyrin repeat domain-containing protein 16-like [Aphidius gifuensis]KAF7990077.1 hypothetical protein HCN44_009020 [Aphidius gifuensis]
MNNDDDIAKELLRATQKGDLKNLKIIINNYDIKDWTKYRQNNFDDTALHVASREGHFEIVKYLCNEWSHPAFKVDVTNKDMKRPLHEAAQFSKSNIVEFLIKQGATVDVLKRADWTPLMLACTKDGTDALNCVKILLDAKADVKIKNKDGWNALLIACRTGDIDIIKLLIKTMPESIKTTSKNGRTALHILAYHGCSEAIDYLLLLEPKLLEITDSSGSTPLHESVKSLNFEIFKKLIKHGADFKITNCVGQNILHIAVVVCNIQVIDYILSNCLIDLHICDNYGTNPLALAQRYQLNNVIDLLIKYDTSA